MKTKSFLLITLITLSLLLSGCFIVLPQAPYNLTIVKTTSDSVSLQWGETSNNVTKFQISRSTNDASFSNIGTVGKSVNIYTDESNILPNTIYYYRVRAYNKNGNSAWSNVATALTKQIVPSVPYNLHIIRTSQKEITFSWNEISQNVKWFNVWRKYGSQQFTICATVNSTITQFTDSNLDQWHNYSYAVSAYNIAGDSLKSNIITSTRPGTIKWKRGTGGYVSSSPVLSDDGYIYLASEDGYIYSYDQNNKPRWKYNTLLTNPISIALSANSQVYYTTQKNTFCALNSDGTKKWSFPISSPLFAPLVGNDGTVYVTVQDGSLVRITQNSSPFILFRASSQITTSPVIGNSTIYFGTKDGYLYSVDKSGNLNWKYPFYAPLKFMAVNNGVIYTTTTNGVVYAIKSSGNLLWYCNLSMAPTSSFAINSDGTLYIAAGNILYAISNGYIKWNYQVDGEITSTPAVANNGNIYFGSDDDYLYALNKNGNMLWKFQTYGKVETSPVIDQNGTVYFGSDDDYLYAIYITAQGLANSNWPMYRANARHMGM